MFAKKENKASDLLKCLKDCQPRKKEPLLTNRARVYYTPTSLALGKIKVTLYQRVRSLRLVKLNFILLLKPVINR